VIDLGGLSDDALKAMYQEHTPEGVAGLVRAEAERQGVDPDLALRVARQESGLDHGRVSPKGARGVMQLMPDTAADLGVDPSDIHQNIRGGVGYLKRQIDSFGDPKLALAAYNAGPERVREAGGVPDIPETRHYVSAILGEGDDGSSPAAPDLSAMSDDELKAAYAGAGDAPVEPQPAEREIARSRNGGVTITVPSKLVRQGPAVPLKADRPSALVDAAQQYPLGVKQGAAQIADAVSSFTPLNFIGRMKPGNPFGVPSLAGVAGDLITRLATRHDPAPQTKAGEYAKTFGQMTPNAIAPGSIPQRVASVVLPGLGMQGAGDAAKSLGASPALTDAARVLGGLVGGAASGLRITRPQAAPKVSLADLDHAQDAAWKAVEASGYRFPQAEVKSAASDITSIVDDADPDLYEGAAKVAAKVERMAERGELTPGQANRLRSQVREKLLSPGSTEISVGKAILGRLDALIDSSAEASPLLKDARTKYTQFLKMKEVSDRLDSADLAASASGVGSNIDNATRRKLIPLIDKKSTQRIRNLTPDEQQALRTVAKGSAPQNVARLLSAFDPFHSKIGAMFQAGAGLGSHGASLLMAPVGLGATLAERAMARSNLAKLLATISAGGKAPAGPALSYQPGELANLPLIPLIEASQSRPSPAPQRR
jgi:hypothetical protein